MLDWGAFKNLSGSQEDNFEILCRIIIHRNFSRFGNFAALASQPGVEFHLKLDSSCSLGKLGDWYGWQCRWYDLPSGKAIGTTRKSKIIEAIKTTERVLPDLTNWVLWTRHPLTAGDQDWYYGLKTHMKLHLWTESNIEEYLCGEAEIYRSTFFGELILTPTILTSIHQLSIASIKHRWQPEIHQTIETERTLRKMLGEPNSWNELPVLANRIKNEIEITKKDAIGLPQSIQESFDRFIKLGMSITEEFSYINSFLSDGNIDNLLHRLTNLQISITSDDLILPRHLRSARHRSAISATNLLADIRTAHDALDKLNHSLSERLIAVHANAGYGKTELAAQLTSGIDNRPPGILLHGRDLSARNSLDDMAHRIVIQGKSVQTIEALLAAVDSAGRRSNRRLPIVIDGLNEAEDPRDWKTLLSSLDILLCNYPYVLFICTLRTAFVEETIPEGITRLEIQGFEEDTIEAIKRYFKFYKINPSGVWSYRRFLEHPLTLRLFCEVTNPDREHGVGIEAMPVSLTDLFIRYIEQSCKRIVELAPRSHRLHEMDLRTALDEIGKALWEEKSRCLNINSLRKRLGDDKHPWADSILRAFEQDGILLRGSNNSSNNSTDVSVMYDLLAGHLISESIITKYGGAGFATWLQNLDTMDWLAGPFQNRHPLATDIFQALIGLVPRHLHGQQLWQLLEEPMRTSALIEVINLEGKYIDSESVKQLSSMISKSNENARKLFPKLIQTRSASAHPLNSEFLDDTLRSMSVSQRDIIWTEWIRHNRDDLVKDLELLEKKWRNISARSLADKLCAKWIIWVLTSTVHKLRDQATSTLYWFGRGDPSMLFDLTFESLSINDSYIPERLLAASYGVIMANQKYDTNFVTPLSFFLQRICESVIGVDAEYPTNHWLSRLYIQGIVTFTYTYYPEALPTNLRHDPNILFASGLQIEAINENDLRAEEINHSLHIDFKNYTIGRLFPDRRNYDMDHRDYLDALAYIRGTIWSFGWRENELGGIDKNIVNYHDYSDHSRIDRYGKKYSWIGFYSYAGLLANQGKLSEEYERLSFVDIDPSFPESPQPLLFSLPFWAQPLPKEDKRWILEGNIEIPDDVLYRTEINSHPGPWVVTYGFIKTNKQAPGREVYGLISALIAPKKYIYQLVQAFNQAKHPGSFQLSEIPEDYYTFAGEIPWSPNFSRYEIGENNSEKYYKEVSISKGISIKVEMLAHEYSWEKHHSILNGASGALIPPRTFSNMFDLRGLPQSFDQILPDGSFAALSFSAPKGFEGNLLYLREDLLRQYIGTRNLIWFIWGERELHFDYFYEPDWLLNIRRNGGDVWRYVRYGKNFSRFL